jgi:hypothetical protein
MLELWKAANCQTILVFVGDRDQLVPIGHQLGAELPIMKHIVNNPQHNVRVYEKLKTIVRSDDPAVKAAYMFYININTRADRAEWLSRVTYMEMLPSHIEWVDVMGIPAEVGDDLTIVVARNDRRLYYNHLCKNVITMKQGKEFIDYESYVNGFCFDVGDKVVTTAHVSVTKYTVSADPSSTDASECLYPEDHLSSMGERVYTGKNYIIMEIKPYTIVLSPMVLNVLSKRTLPPCIIKRGWQHCVNGYLVKLRDAYESPSPTGFKGQEIIVLTKSTFEAITGAITGMYRDQFKNNGRGGGQWLNKKLYWQVMDFIDSNYGQLQHAYAMTLYKSQGITYKRVMADVMDIHHVSYIECRQDMSKLALCNGKFLDSMYVATSRASTGLKFIRS